MNQRLRAIPEPTRGDSGRVAEITSIPLELRAGKMCVPKRGATWKGTAPLFYVRPRYGKGCIMHPYMVLKPKKLTEQQWPVADCSGVSSRNYVEPGGRIKRGGEMDAYCILMPSRMVQHDPFQPVRLPRQSEQTP